MLIDPDPVQVQVRFRFILTDSALILMFLLKNSLFLNTSGKICFRDSVETDTGYFETQQLILFAGLIRDETLWEYADIMTYFSP